MLSIIVMFITLFKVSIGDVLVHTNSGSISGAILIDYNGNNYYAFQSIPYAQSPVGELRFRPPQPPKSWQGIKDGTKPAPVCVQPAHPNAKFSGQEDCLYLNVYTNAIEYQQLAPVLVYLHSGGFFALSGSFLQFNPSYLITEGIVIVTLNYRLGAFGFLTLNTNSTLISANNGFRDQVAALKWIQTNIAAFGGDPDRVTLSGASAGALATHYHLFAPMSRGLFQQAICRSGTVLQSTTSIPANTAILLAEQLQINTTNLVAMVQHLRFNSTPFDIHNAQLALRWLDFHLNSTMYNGLFLESEDNEDPFITGSLLDRMQDGDYYRVPMMISVTTMEGLLLNSSAIPNLSQMSDLSTHIPMEFGSNSALVRKHVEEFYLQQSLQHPFVDFWSDIWFRFAAYKSAQISSQYQRIYLHYFGLDTKLNVFKLSNPSIAYIKGAAHTDDDYYLYVRPGTPKITPNSLEETLMRRMIRLQANFVKFGNPTPQPDEILQNIYWNPYNIFQDSVLSITNNNLTFGNYLIGNFNFWNTMYELYAGKF